MPVIFDNERKNYIPNHLLKEEIRYGTGCRLGGAVYLPSRQYSYNGSAFIDYLPLSPIIKNVIETGKLVKDIVSADNAVLNSENIGDAITDPSIDDLAKLLNENYLQKMERDSYCYQRINNEVNKNL